VRLTSKRMDKEVKIEGQEALYANYTTNRGYD
jgi:hypothetical protein